MNYQIFENELEAFKDAEAEELFINSPRYAEWVLRDGKIVPRKFPYIKNGAKTLRYFLQDFAFKQNTRLDLQVPAAGGQWGSFRWQACIPPATSDGGLLSLRRVFPQIWEVGDFCMDEPLRKEISDIFRQNKNLVVFGRPGEGKTSFVSALCHAFYSTKRVLFFEDCEEIPLAQPRWVRLLKSQPDRHTNAQQQIKDQVKSSLRLRPDAFVFGETRDEEDIQNFCNARFAIPSTCLTTFHATDEKTSQCRWKALGGSTNGIVFLKVPARKKLPRKT